MNDQKHDPIARIREFLKARSEVTPDIVDTDVIVDIDYGSRGHYRLHAKDIEALVERAHTAERWQREVAIGTGYAEDLGFGVYIAPARTIVEAFKEAEEGNLA